MKITLKTAEAVITAAKAAAEYHRLPPMSITVVDDGAHLVAFARMDGTFLGATDVAHRKARTAALFAANTAVLGPNLRPGAAAYTLEHTNGGLIGFGGGVLLKNKNGEIIGAVGVSGGSVRDDEVVAQAAAASTVK